MNAMQLPYLTDAEIMGMCEPLVQPGAQCKHLKAIGFMVKTKPNGKPLVARSEFERVLGAAHVLPDQPESTHGPNVTALREHIRRKQDGTRT